MDITKLRDGRVECWSLMTGMSVRDYLAVVLDAYKNRGGIKGQREKLKTTTGRRIRARMIEDIRRGAILPPVVVGVVVQEDLDAIVETLTADQIVARMALEWINGISIIDGMQRTTALIEAAELSAEVMNRPIRVECWLSRSTDSLIYRMLVLNTGQVPWNINRQLEVIYAPLVDQMMQRVKFERLLSPEKGERRFKGGEFSPPSLLEAYIAFGLRRTEIDTQETLADEFSRLDIADAISSEKYNTFFYPIVQLLVDLDKAFARTDVASDEAANEQQIISGKFKNGRNIFDSQPARIGFVVACSLNILGRLGMDKTEEEGVRALDQIRSDADVMLSRLQGLAPGQLNEFLSLDVLSEKLGGQKRSAVGRHERAFFETAFKVLIETRFEVPAMEVCWRAA